MVYFKNAKCLLIFFTGIFLFFGQPCSSQNNNNKIVDSLLKKLPELSGIDKARVLNDLSYYSISENIDLAIQYGNRALSLANELNDSLLLATVMNDVSLAYYYKSNYDSVLILAEHAYVIRLAKKQWRDAGASISKAALAYYEKGKYAKSLEKNLLAIELLKKAGATAEVLQLQNNVGSIYEINRQLEEAKKMYAEAAEGGLELKNYNLYVTAKTNYGSILQKQGKINEAKAIYLEVLPICIKYCEGQYLAEVYQSLGVVERFSYNDKAGLDYYLKAKAIYDKMGSVGGMSIINTNIGLCYIDLKKYKEADEFLQLGLKQSKEIKSWYWQKKAYLGLYTLERQRGNFKLSNDYLEKHQRVNDSLYNEETQDKLGKLQTEYEVQQKENTILSQQNTISQNELAINKRNSIIIIVIAATVVLLLLIVFMIQRNSIIRKRAELSFQSKIQKERSRISKDLHDNMGAELTIISSAIDIKAHGIEKEKDKAELEMISDQVRKASALMRDTIWTISEENISISQFGIKIKEFAERAFAQKNIQLHFKNTNKELYLRPESTLNLFRIVQELINNASKHSEAKNFYIENFTNDILSIELSDDGKGFDPDTVERGYGLNNVMQRAKDINATIDLDIKKDEFTKVKVTLSESSIWMG